MFTVFFFLSICLYYIYQNVCYGPAMFTSMEKLIGTTLPLFAKNHWYIISVILHKLILSLQICNVTIIFQKVGPVSVSVYLILPSTVTLQDSSIIVNIFRIHYLGMQKIAVSEAPQSGHLTFGTTMSFKLSSWDNTCLCAGQTTHCLPGWHSQRQLDETGPTRHE